MPCGIFGKLQLDNHNVSLWGFRAMAFEAENFTPFEKQFSGMLLDPDGEEILAHGTSSDHMFATTHDELGSIRPIPLSHKARQPSNDR